MVFVNPKPNGFQLFTSHIDFMSNGQTFTHKINMWIYIKYFMQNQLLDSFPNPDMEFIVQNNHNKILTSKNWWEHKTDIF